MTEEELNALNEMITEQLAKGFIASSTAPHCAPVFFVKTGGEGTGGKPQKLRLVVDYRELNRRSAKNEYPVPLISQTLTALSKAKIFTKLDLRAGFNQKVDAAFFGGTTVKSNFLCNLGYGDPAKLFLCSPRLSFAEACSVQ